MTSLFLTNRTHGYAVGLFSHYLQNDSIADFTACFFYLFNPVSKLDFIVEAVLNFRFSIDFSQKNDGKRHKLPTPGKVVVISMYAEKREIARFNALNIAGYIAKTVAADRLLTLLQQGHRVIETDDPESPAPLPGDVFRQKYGLTKREVEILKGVEQGLTIEQIADQLCLSHFTVQTHRKNISQKLPFTTQKDFYNFIDTLD